MLYLHIGTSKTGTTSLQNFLGSTPETPVGYRQVPAFGLGYGWKLAAAMRTKYSDSFFVNLLKRISADDLDPLSDGIWDAARADIAPYPGQTFVASCEHLFSQTRDNPAVLTHLRTQLFDLFGDVRVIVYLRDQRASLKSRFGQRVSGPARATESYEALVTRLIAQPAFLDYERILRPWVDVFGRERMRVALFDRAAFVGGDLTRDFLHRLDIAPETAEAALRQTAPSPRNVSPVYWQLQMLRQVNRLRPVLPVGVDRRLRRICITGHTAGLGPQKVPDIYDDRILARFSAGNAWVNATFFADSPAGLPVQEADAGAAPSASGGR